MSFKGTFNQSIQKYAVIASEDARMGAVGMGSYNEKTFKKVMTDKESQKEMVQSLVNPCLPASEDDQDEANSQIEEKAQELIQAFTGNSNTEERNKGEDGQNSYGFYYKFDQESNKYKKTGVQVSIPDLMEYWDKSQKDPEHLDTSPTNKDIITNVRNSLEGCIIFFPDYDNNSENFKKSRVFFRDATKADDSREMVLNGDPKISATPRRPTGAKYDFTRSQNSELTGIDETDDENKNYGHIGRYIRPVENSEIPDQAVSSKLRLSYNKALGYYESGTQSVIARLIDSLPAPGLKDVNVEGADELKFVDMYDPEGKGYFGGFTTGFAIPLTVHNGNPNTFGPNVIGKKTEYKKEKIRVVNRANSSFNIGDIVMCSLIDNEWIVQGFGGEAKDELEKITFTVGRWSFIKMIADSDAYFRDNRWWEYGDDEYNQFYRQDTFITERRTQFYIELSKFYATSDNLRVEDLNNISALSLMNYSVLNTVEEFITGDANWYTLPVPTDIDIIPSRRYVQSSSFDQLGYHMGGNNENGNIIGRTNWRSNPDTSQTYGRDLAEYATEIPLFWGPVFPDGYNTSQGRKLTTKILQYKSNGSESFFGPDRTQLDINSISDDNNILDDKKTYMFANQRDFALDQIPADVATNAQPSGDNGYPIENISLLGKKEKQWNNLPQVFNQYMKDSGRLCWLSELVDDNKSVYDLKPNTSTSLDFIPLSFAMAGNSDAASTVDSYGGYNTYDMARSFIREDKRSIPHFWGNMFERETPLTDHDFIASKGRDITHTVLNEASFAAAYPNLPWDKYIKRKAYNGPDATPFYFGDTYGERGANLVGIVAARNTFSINAGGTINFECDYFIGINGQNQVTGSAGTMTVIPTTPPVTFGTGPSIRTYGIVQWGSRDTRPIAMGHTSLYVKIFDHWPYEDTVYDARYYSVYHFLPGMKDFNKPVKTEQKGVGTQYEPEWNPEFPASGWTTAALGALEYPRDVDVAEYSTDFRVPTYGNPLEGGDSTGGMFASESDNDIVPLITTLGGVSRINRHGTLKFSDEFAEAYTNSKDDNPQPPSASTDYSVELPGKWAETEEDIIEDPEDFVPFVEIAARKTADIMQLQTLRKETEWRVNPICRGMMVSHEGGFKYFRRTIGVDHVVYFIDRGTGFAVDDEIILDEEKSIKIKITSTEGEGAIKSFMITDRGKDLFTSDFFDEYQAVDNEGQPTEAKKHGLLFNVKSEAGKNASILFMFGKVYDRPEETRYAKQHGSMKNLTPASQPGDSGPIFGRKVASTTIESASSDNQYDAFYYHVNDVTHVDTFSYQGTSPIFRFQKHEDSTNNNYYVRQSAARLQRVSLNINAT